MGFWLTSKGNPLKLSGWALDSSTNPREARECFSCRFFEESGLYTQDFFSPVHDTPRQNFKQETRTILFHFLQAKVIKKRSPAIFCDS